MKLKAVDYKKKALDHGHENPEDIKNKIRELTRNGNDRSY
jgi:hypothetical protein